MSSPFLQFSLCAVILSARCYAAPLVSISRLDTDQTAGTESISLPLQIGGPLYQDYSFTYSSLPSHLVGAQTIRMVNADAGDADYRLQLTLSEPATVYLFVDDRTSTAALPWIVEDGFQNTGEKAVVFGTIPYSIYAAPASAGTFTVKENAGGLNMYHLAVVPEPCAGLLCTVGVAFGLGRRRRSAPGKRLRCTKRSF